MNTSATKHPQIRVVIQSRLSSSRLPGKALLPLGGLPSVVLCALRAGSFGADVVVATSVESSDDAIETELDSVGIRVVRGSLDDVLGRFIAATSDLHDDAIVIRLTADNVLPDGQLIKEALDHFVSNNDQYVGTNWPLDGQPYGLSIEAFTVRVLREAHARATERFDREHVTTWIRRNYPSASSLNIGMKGNYSHIRCTIDTFEDYVRMYDVFNKVRDPVSEGYESIVLQLQQVSRAPRFSVPYVVKRGELCSSLTLGTVQLGVPYGATNTVGLPSIQEACEIVRYAIKYGVNTIDTARAYGLAEERIGDALSDGATQVKVITKLDPLADIDYDASSSTIRHAVDASVYRSCFSLRVRKISTLLLHRWKHRTSHNGNIWKRLQELKSEGIIQELGVSVSSPEEALEAVNEPEITHIQLPYNLLDWRWKKAGLPQKFLERPNLIVHCRSSLLQGILVNEPKFWPLKTPEAELWVTRISRVRNELQRSSNADLCLAYIRSQNWIASTVVGVESITQLEEILSLFLSPLLSNDEIEFIEEKLAGAPLQLLDPSQWRKNK